jgi:hypothetical protein
MSGNTRRTSRAGAGLIAAASLCLALPGLSSAETTSTNEPFASEIDNACFEGELVTVVGKDHTLIDDGGNLVHENVHATGVAADGTSYTYKTNYHLNQTSDPGANGATVFHNTYKVVLNRAGSDSATDDLKQNIKVHTTVNANGDTTAQQVDFGGTECH